MFGCSYVSVHSAILVDSKEPGEWFKPDGTSLFLEFVTRPQLALNFPRKKGEGSWGW